MDPISLSQIATWSAADLISGNPQVLVQGVSHDTRSLKPGELYIALPGEHFDGNYFIKEALRKGAVGVLYEGVAPMDLPSDFGLLRVTNPLQGLTSLARAWRGELGLRAIVLTGSNGKTTTKDFTTVLLNDFLRVTATQGNFNNHIGLPLSILRSSQSDQVAVWEIGMNHRGEIAPLAALAKPAIAIITNIGTAHIGHLGSREAIAQEKGDLLVELSSEGVAILPAGDDFYGALASRVQGRIVSVGIGVGDLQANALVPTAHGMQFQVSYQGVSLPAFLPVMGAPMVHNALSALAVALECGLSLQEGISALEKVQPSYGRLMLHECGGVTLIDDSYNANPDSMEAGLSALRGFKAQRRIAVLGFMGELGDYALQGYERVGRSAAANLDILIVVGEETTPLARAARDAGIAELSQVSTNEEATARVLSILRPGDILLVKGSRSARVNEVVEAVRASLCEVSP